MRIYLLILLSLAFLYGQDGCTDVTACNYANQDNDSCLPNEGIYSECDDGTTGCDCNNECGGGAIVDVCNICSSGTTGHAFNSDLDCNGDCFGGSLEDICGVCDGLGPVSCWDGSLVCGANDCPFNPDDCPFGTVGDSLYLNYNNICVPTVFSSVIQSTQQSFYFFESVTINGVSIDADDWVGAYNLYDETQNGSCSEISEACPDINVDGILSSQTSVCVGATKWDTSQCGGVCDVKVMGYDSWNSEETAGYCMAGDIPTFQIYDSSENMYYYAQASNDITWKYSETSLIDNLNSESPLSIFDGTIPDTYSIYNIYPNPFNPITSIEYSLPENASIELIIYNIHGRHIQTLIQGFQTAGYHSINWNASNYPSGVYLIRLESSIYSKTQKVVLIK